MTRSHERYRPMPHDALYAGFANKGRPSQFDGIEYRTRSEAKWALVLTRLGLRFYYEPSRYYLPSGVYEPDFWVPQLDAFLEVKPFDYDDARYAELGEKRSARVFVVVGNMPQIPTTKDEGEILKALGGHIWQKSPEDRKHSYMLAREAQGRINIVPVALGSLASGLDAEILQSYVLASSTRFE